MKRFLVVMAALCVVVSMTALAQEAPVPLPVADDSAGATLAIVTTEATEITLTGKIVKVEPKIEGGKATFVLVTKDSKITLPETKAEVADLAKFVGKDVKVVANGVEKMVGEKKVVQVDSIVKVEEAVPAPAKTN
ncbi:MAG: hypothetical protein L6455_05060 [Kiritimatiellae bacterium]|nr:hypothetical protein [Verrucomicrobiota bacterium]MBU4291736.1 hypothetical protein [Verrucomicrobiota bacterium]MCG2679326.1 hypothetical protein [Kiritimatiellia bacterium]